MTIAEPETYTFQDVSNSSKWGRNRSSAGGYNDLSCLPACSCYSLESRLRPTRLDDSHESGVMRGKSPKTSKAE